MSTVPPTLKVFTPPRGKGRKPAPEPEAPPARPGYASDGALLLSWEERRLIHLFRAWGRSLGEVVTAIVEYSSPDNEVKYAPPPPKGGGR